MDAVSLLVVLLAKSFLLALPVAIAWLAFRRLTLSATANAWVYAVTGLFAAFSAAGLAPWALGLGTLGWPFLLFAMLCPPLWLAVVATCGADRSGRYARVKANAPRNVDDAALSAAPPAGARPAPLVLSGPEWPKAPRAVFRSSQKAAAATNRNAAPASPRVSRLLAVARDMRSNASSEARRERLLLPPPERMSDLPDLPFLRSGN